MQALTAERILETANTLLINRGYSAFSYADIADAIHIRKASIHYHFPTKSGLVVAVLRRHRTRIAEAMASLDHQFENALTRIRNYFKYWEDCIADGTLSFCVGALLGAEMPSLPEEVQVEVQLHFSMLTQWFERTLQAGVETQELQLQDSVTTEAQIVIAVLHGGMLSARAASSRTVFHSLSEAMLRRMLPTTL